MVSLNPKQTIHRDMQHTRAGRHFGDIIVRHLSDMKCNSLLWATGQWRGVVISLRCGKVGTRKD